VDLPKESRAWVVAVKLKNGCGADEEESRKFCEEPL
jgi:hypothetical protein